MGQSGEFDLQFPVVKNVSAKTIGSELVGLVPDSSAKELKETWTDHCGGTTNVYKDGSKISFGSGTNHLYGDCGHSFMDGFYIIDKDGNMVFRDDPEYYIIHDFCRPVNKLMLLLRDLLPDYRVERGRADRLFVNDKMIKGILIYPGMRISGTIEEAAKSILEFIQADIESGRIRKGVYGIEK